MKRIDKIWASLGMIGSVIYICHTVLGRLLWREYNPITTDISSLTAIGAPDRELLSIFTTMYGIFVILFALYMVKMAFSNHNMLLRVGWIIYLVMQIVSCFGYMLFPLSKDKTEMTFGNTMHIVVTMIVVFTTITSGFVLAAGYLKEPEHRWLGKFTLIIAMLITVFGAMNPIGMANHWNILGLTERIVIYSLQLFTFVISDYYTVFRKS